uniref:Fatty acid desaturase n=1 Tax=Cyanothece sp. (strain PCC 7425 / ATCC 29141) TaxID=395961 RepID=B8HKY6_CYAP4
MHLGVVARAIGLQIFYLLGTGLAAILIAFSGLTWVDASVFVLMWVLAGIGGTVGYHRLLAHKAFETTPQLKILLAILGAISGQGPLLPWVAFHRQHHHCNDRPGDPHTPYFNHEGQTLSGWPGFWHAHFGWLLSEKLLIKPMKYARDIVDDPVLVRISQNHYAWFALGFLIPTILGGLLTVNFGGWSWIGATKGFLLGGFTRVFLMNHLAAHGINSFCHLFGQRPFQSSDQSTNNAWLGLLILTGEPWHNNHHAFPNSARFGLKWWQVDIGYMTIWVLEKMGLAWQVNVPSPQVIKARTISEVSL